MTTKILNGVYAVAYNLTSPVTTLSISASGYLGAGLFSAGVGSYDIVNAGVVKGGYYAISLAGSGTITNTSTIRAGSTLKGAAIELAAGGKVTNAAGGAITGYSGVVMAAGSGVVDNQGLIAATGKYGVYLAGGGLVTNGGAGNTAATIRGVIAIEADHAATLHNYGTLTGAGTQSAAGYFKAGGLAINGSATDTSATMSGHAIAFLFNNAAGTLANYGSIIATGTAAIGVEFGDGGLVTNGSEADTTAVIEATAAAIIVGVQAGTVRNFGTLISGYGAGAGVTGVYLTAGGTVTNGSAADTSALIDTVGMGVGISGVSGALTNYGTIETTGTAGIAALMAGGSVTNGSKLDTTALIQGSAFGVAVGGAPGTVTNFGTVLGGYSADGLEFGVYMIAGGIITSGSASDNTARIGGFVGVYIKNAVGTVTNFGTVGGANSAAGVGLQKGGLIVNGSASDTIALIQGYIGVVGEAAAITVHNFGSIEAGGGPGVLTLQEGAVALMAGGLVTNGSSTDTTALLTGVFGVTAQTIAATVNNFGSIVGELVGVYTSAGGKITNGSASDTAASIVGPNAGVDVATTAGTVINFGTIRGGLVGYDGVAMVNGGVLTNGSATDHAALISGFIGVQAGAAAAVTNNATISGDLATGSYGVSLVGAAKLTNNAGAVISGLEGVAIGVGCTATNFGTIRGLNGEAVRLNDATARFDMEGGSSIIGDIRVTAGGVIDVVGGVAFTNGVETDGKVIGAGTLGLGGGPTLFYAGASLTVAEIEVTGGAEVFVETKLTDSKVWAQSGGTLTVESGDQMTFTGADNSFSGTVTGPGKVSLSGGGDTLSNVAISAGKMTISKSAVTFSGSVSITGTVSATSPSLVVAAGGATLSGGGELLLSNTATNSLHGANSGATLTNGDTIRGAGSLGGGTMVLTNAASGVIEGVGSAGLVIDTGANTIANAGTIEALTGDVTTIASAVANSGLLASSGGTLVLEGAVTGAGTVHVFGGVVSLAKTFNEHVSFGSSGRLVLAHSTGFASTVSGFSHTGTTSLDLRDIKFASAAASFSGTTASGVLTLTDGTHTAHITLTGDYTAAAWTLSDDGSGGTVVVDPTAAKAHAIVAAAAAMATGPAAASPSPAPPGSTPLLLAPR
ncbi:MAG TPA: hypothetical protein VG166_10860 [Caulobacteraceae bacterium]|jgi:hypothetical protein|nr:hypothetical protein [Caulobacteraceae bacterium]